MVFMKNQRIFPGIILIGFGAYFFLQQSNIALFQEFYTWPTLLVIVGISFLAQGYGAKDYEAILPGAILTGFGLHFHMINHFELWPNHIGTFILIIAIGFLLRYQKVRSGLFQGILFLVLALLLLFYDRVIAWFGILESTVSIAWKSWPIVLVLIGSYLLFVRKK